MADPKPAPRHLSVVAQPHEARTLKLAAALEAQSLSAWLLTVGLKQANRVMVKHGYTSDGEAA